MKKLAALLLAACTGAVAFAQDIKIGGLLETSGFVASLGQPGLEGAMLAIDQVNAAGGIQGRKVTLVNLNSESDNTKTVAAARRLIEHEKVSGIIGPMSTGSVFAVVDVVERARLPMVANSGTRGTVLPPERRTYSFLAPLTDVVVQTAMLKDMQARGIQRVAMLHSDVAFGTSGRDTLEALAPKYGIQVVLKESFSNADTDMTPQLTKIRGADVQATVVWATGPGLAISTKNHRALGISTPLYMAHSANDFNYLRLAGASADNILLPSSKLYVAEALPASDAQKAVVSKFVADFEKKYGRPPSTFAGNGYDAAMLLVEAIRKAGTEPAAVRDALEKTSGHVGVTAMYTYARDDHFGARPESVMMLTVKNGRFLPAVR